MSIHPLPSPVDPGAVLGTVTVAEVMHRGIVTVEPDASLAEIARAITKHRVHCVVISGILADSVHGERLAWGIVSDLDLVGAAIAGDTRCAAQLAATEIVTVDQTDTLDRAAQLIAEHGNAHVVVVDEAAGYPVGVVSTFDIAAALAG